MVFDLDGTLVKTEQLKAKSYALAVLELCDNTFTEAQVLEAFKEVVGLLRREVVNELIRRFNLHDADMAHIDEFGAHTAWQAFVQIRIWHYEGMMEDPQILLENRWAHNLELLEQARHTGCKTGLATMSRCVQVQHVLKVLDLTGTFDFVASRDDVERGKPDPEINLPGADQLNVSPEDCLVIEDAPIGVRAALAAGMWCIAVSSPFTQKTLSKQSLLNPRWIVDEPETLTAVVETMFLERHSEAKLR